MKPRQTGEDAAPPRLIDFLPQGAHLSPDEVLDRFLAWVAGQGLEPYPAQEEALLELMTGHHVVLDTPTGSGKSLVALGLHFKALSEGRRSFYTAPIKALVSEKFFALCREFGPENVGMLTGDASINWAAPVVCCTAEVLSNMALRQGEDADAPYVVMDEFHYYADRDRGQAWQIPLLVFRNTRFLLMSATLGNTAPIEERLRARTGRPVAHVYSELRPVPLDYEYRETTLTETVEGLVRGGRSPIYIVHFTQRDAADQAQGFTSSKLSSPEKLRELARELADQRFDSPYGRHVKRFLRHGVGIHHAGLLPRYRLLVEKLSQRGLLAVICGTDTLGVGVNIPIRTVLFSRLCKFDGEKVRILSVRDFKQIAGRAGRKGFDDRGSVVCQAPEHVVENLRREARRAESASGRRRKPARKKQAPRGLISWNRDIFEKLCWRPPEPLRSRFRLDHGTVVNLLQRAGESDDRVGGYREIAELISRCHEDARRKRRLLREAAVLFRSLRRSGVVEVERGARGSGARVLVKADLQRDFSLHRALSLYLVEAVAALDPEASDYALEILSVVEAILENPRAILIQQQRKLRKDLLARLKAEGVPFEERGARLDKVTWPQPDAEFINATFSLFSEQHPWVGGESIHLKMVAREMFERYADFGDYVRRYDLERMEGLLLRYLSQVHNTLVRSVPASARSDAVVEVIGFFRALLTRVDASLLEAWEGLLRPEAAAEAGVAPAAPVWDERAFRARVRAELHLLVQALSRGDFERAVGCVRHDADDPWDADRFREALAPYFDEYPELVFGADARRHHLTRIEARGPRQWHVQQVLVDPEGDNQWIAEGEIDLGPGNPPDGPLIALRRIRS